MFSSKIVFRPLYRSITTTPSKFQKCGPSKVKPPSLIKLKKLQADYQLEDGRPVWLKGGFMDRILSGTTFLLCAVGFTMVIATIYDHAKPPSWKTKTC